MRAGAIVAFADKAAYNAAMRTDTQLEAPRTGSSLHPGWEELVNFVSVARQRLGEALERASGLALGDYEALLAVQRSDGRLRITDLARGVGLSAGGCSRMVQRLVQAGLLERCPCPTDRRVSYACLTADGRHALERAHAAYDAEVAAVYGDRTTEGEKTALANLFRRLVEPTPPGGELRARGAASEDGEAMGC
jgi:MarR family 2-MHQ and catechol resistance regulon transcriptional repressor